MAKKKEQKQEGLGENLPAIPAELKEKMDKIKTKLDNFSKKVVDKFGKYIVGVALLPPPQPKPGMPTEEVEKLKDQKDKIFSLVLIDDSEPSKMSKEEMHQKLNEVIQKTAEETDKNLVIEVLTLSSVWQDCYDGKSEKLQLIAMSAPVYDTGTLSAIKIAEVHKTMVLKKFEKYIVAYVLAGSIVQGRATKESDIDVFLIIDDTDVKKMSRAELKDKLRQIILGMGFQAGEITGIKNKINIQVYILTDFWESVKEAHPVIFTFLRDGVPFYDRGIFMPWKQLLKMGRIKPSPEAIDMYMSTGEQMIQRIKAKIREIGIEDLFWSTLTPSQAALMMYGVPPPTPKETPQVLRDVFVKKEKLLTESDVKIMENLIKTRKELEHGENKKGISGKMLDEMLDGAEKYLKRIRKLFTQLEKIREEEAVVNLADTLNKILRDILALNQVYKVEEENLLKVVKKELVSTGKVTSKQFKQVEDIFKAKKDYLAGKMTKSDVIKNRKESGELLRTLIELVQRERGKELSKTKFHVKYGEKYGEVVLLEDKAFVIQDVDAEEKVVEVTEVKNGKFGTLKKSSMEELENAVAEAQIPRKVFIHEPVFESLKGIFGKDVQIMVHH